MRPERMIRTCQERGINVLAVTDHNEFDGALEVAAAAPDGFNVIPSEEIKSSEGEIIGYFLNRHIPRGLPPEEPAERIRAQGGVVNVPHPFDTLRGGRLSTPALDRLASLGLIDMIEGFNARMTRPEDNDQALVYAREHDLPVTGGSDAHSYGELGAAYTELRPFDGPRDFVHAVRDGMIGGGLSPWPVHFVSTWAKVAKKVGRT